MDLQRLNNIISRGQDDSTASNAYDAFMLVAITISIVPLMFRTEYRVFHYFETITVLIFIADYIARWATSPIRMGKGPISYLLYPFTFMALIDLLSILPAINLLGESFKLFRVTRLLKISRTFKIFRYSSKIEMLGRVLYKERHVLFSVLLISVFYIFVTALIMFNVEPHINPETGEPVFRSFFDAIYWASVTLTTVGYGDLCPVTDIGRTVSIVSSLFGVAIIALPSGVITASYLDELRKEREQHLERNEQ